MSKDAESKAERGSYEVLLKRAGAFGLTDADIDDLVPGLAAIDAKIALLRKASLDDGGGERDPSS